MFNASSFNCVPFNSVPLYGSTPIPIPPYVKRAIQRETISLCMPKITLDLDTSAYADRVVITLKLVDSDLNLNRK